jgi:hypothetical protein
MARINFKEPPSMDNRVDFERYLLELHNLIQSVVDGGRGSLDEQNVLGELTDTTDHSLFTGVTPNQHHDQVHDVNGTDHSPNADAWHDAISGSHSALKQGVAVSDAAIVTTETADSTYSANEVSMLNNLKTDVTTLKNTVNALLASARGGELIDT